MRIQPDCRYFKGEAPCKPHKAYQVRCDGCGHYDRIDSRILIIKLDAVGDVLRTACILPGLRERYPHSHITWVTRKESFPLFRNNSLVDSVCDYSAETFLRVQSEDYDLVISPDASPRSGMLAEAARGSKKVGFGYHRKGYVYPFNQEAQPWFEMGLFDEVKKANTRTYQEILLRMIGLEPSN